MFPISSLVTYLAPLKSERFSPSRVGRKTSWGLFASRGLTGLATYLMRSPLYGLRTAFNWAELSKWIQLSCPTHKFRTTRRPHMYCTYVQITALWDRWIGLNSITLPMRLPRLIGDRHLPGMACLSNKDQQGGQQWASRLCGVKSSPQPQSFPAQQIVWASDFVLGACSTDICIPRLPGRLAEFPAGVLRQIAVIEQSRGLMVCTRWIGLWNRWT